LDLNSITFKKNKAALLLVDIQKGLDDWEFYGGNRNNPYAEANATKILVRFRELQWPIFHVRHSSTNPKSPLYASKPGFQIKDEVKPFKDEPLVTKNVNSAFIGTDLEKRIKNSGIKTLVVVGLTTNHCISTSVRMASNLGYRCFLVADACATFDMIGANGQKFDAELMHQTALASLKDEFATIVETESVLVNL
jgi:nicotinamidase-related amidase